MNILYEDNHLIIVSKTCHEIVQADKTGDEPLSETLKAYIKERDQKPGNVFLGVTHRLDRPTSGTVIFAKTSKALERMNRMFAEGKVHKIYWAIVPTAQPLQRDLDGHFSPLAKDIPAEADLRHWLVRNEKANRSVAYDTLEEALRHAPQKECKEARLHYRVIASTERYALLEIQLFTGRHHQIRCQLSHIGLPIKGDLKYGAPRSNPDGGISLHSRRATFVHPVSQQEICVTSPVPDDTLWKVLASAVD